MSGILLLPSGIAHTRERVHVVTSSRISHNFMRRVEGNRTLSLVPPAADTPRLGWLALGWFWLGCSDLRLRRNMNCLVWASSRLCVVLARVSLQPGPLPTPTNPTRRGILPRAVQ